MSYESEYMKLREQRERNSSNAGGSNPPASKSGTSGTVGDRVESRVREIQGAMDRARSMSGVSTGSYYSRPKVDDQGSKLQRNVAGIRLEMAEKTAAVDRAMQSVQQREADLQTVMGYLDQAKAAYDRDPTDESADNYNKIAGAYNLAYQIYSRAYDVYTAAYDSYKPYEDKLVNALVDYRLYMNQQQNAYDDWRRTIRDSQIVKVDLDAVNAQIADLEKQERAQRNAQYSAANYKGGVQDPTMMTSTQYGPGVRTEPTTENAISLQMQELLNRRALLQEEYGWSQYFPYADLANAPDFKEKSQYVSTANGKKRSALDAVTGLYNDESSGWDDPLYEYINGNTAAGIYLANAAVNKYGADNPIGSAFSLAAEGKTESQQMTDQEIATFNYIYATQGKEAAHQYYNYLKSDLNYRQRKSDEEYWARYAEENPVAASVFSWAMTPTKGITYLGQAMDYMADGEIDQNAAYNMGSYISSAMRGQVAKKIEESGKWGKVGSFAYQTGMSMADFLLNTAITGGNQAITLAIMGTGAAADATIEAKDRGLTDDQAFALGTIAGLAEVVTEKVSLETLLNPDLLKNGAVKYILKNMLAEGSEEVGSDVINLFADVLIAKDQSEWHKSIDAYMKDGKTESEAFGLAIRDQAVEMGLDFLGGFLSGGFMSGGNAAIHVNFTGNLGKELGKLNLSEEDVKAFIETGLESAPETASYQIAQELQKKLDAGKKLSNYDISRLHQANIQAIDEENAGKELPDDTAIGDDRTAKNESEIKGLSLPTLEENEQSEIARTRDSVLAEAPLQKTEAEEQYYDRLRKAESDLQISGVLSGATDAQISQAQRIGEIVGKKIVFTSERTTKNGIRNGWYKRDNDTIYINAKSGNPVAQIIGHELTHSVEMADDYHQLAALVKNRIQDTGGNIEAMRQEKADFYRRNGILLDEGQIDKEIVAEYVERNLLTDEQSITQMVQENPSLGQKILNWLNNLLAKLGNKNAQERMFIQQTRDAYRSALQQSRSINRTIQAENAMAEAYAEGDDQAGDAMFDEVWGQPGYVDRMLDNNRYSISKGASSENGMGYVQDQEQEGLSQPTLDIIGQDITIEDDASAKAGESSFQEEFFKGRISAEAIAEDIQKVARMEPVAQITGNEFVKGEKNLITQVTEFFNYLGNRVYNPQLGSVTLDRKGAKSDLGHGLGRKKAASFAAVPDVLARGYVVDYQENWKGRGYDTAVVAAPVRIGDEECLIGIVLNRNSPKNRFYVHEVLTTEDEASPFKTGTREGDPSGNAPSVISILKKIQDVKTGTNAADERNSDVQYSIGEDGVDNRTGGTDVNMDSGRETGLAVEKLPVKALNYLKRAERKLVDQIGKLLNVPYLAKREYLQVIAREISTEYLRDGRVQEDTIDRLFETAYEQGIMVNREFYDENKFIKDYLRTTAVTIGEQDKGDFADFGEFKKKAFGVLKIVNNGGIQVDAAYQQLHGMVGALFPDAITHPADQLRRMYDVAKSIQISEQSLDEYYGKEAQEFKSWAKNDFQVAVGDAIAELRKVRRYANDATDKKQLTEDKSMTEQEITDLYQVLKSERRNYEKAMAKNLLTEEDNRQVSRLMRGDITLDDLNHEKDNVGGITEVYEAKQKYEEIARQIRKWNKDRKAQLMAQAESITKSANTWKDKKMGIQYSRETMERNVRDIIKDRELAERIIDTYFKPVHDAAAQATRLKNDIRNKVRALNLSRKVAEGNQVSEAYAVQLLGEAEDNIRVIQESKGRIRNRDGKTHDEWKAVVNDLWKNNPNLDKRKIRNAVSEFRKIYDSLFQKMNASRIHNGYEPVNYRQGYFPHFQATQSDGIIALFGKALGIETEVTVLPTSINGLTHTFKPGIQWFGSALERKGFQTVYDAVEGIDKYIEGVSDVIYQTDNIQRLRALASQIRYRTTDEGIRKQVDEVRAMEDLADIDKENRIKEIYEKGKFALSNFVVELEEYTNLLANKKSRADRNMEQAIGRDMYNLVKSLESRVAANMVAVNPGSWLTNFIPLTQGAATLDRGRVLKAMGQTLKAYKNEDGIVKMSSFLTNRRGSDPIVKTWQQDLSAKLSSPMEYVDSFTADTLVRARYQQNLERGMSEAEAISEADQWAAGVMADRSKGSMPTLFNRSNPLTKIFTQFQLEVNNQLGYVFKDMPRLMREKGLRALVAALIKFAIGAFMYNEIYEYFIGRRPALDVLGILNDTVGDLTGNELPNLVELGVNAINGEEISFKTKKESLADTVGNLAGEVAEELPFIGGVLGGGRVPISSALPDLDNLSKAVFGTKTEDGEGWSAKKRVSTAARELGKPLTYLVPPFGGGQVKKIWEGIKGVIEGGSYSVDNEGNDLLQYPIYSDDPWEALRNAMRAMVFGKSSLPSAVDWVESGFKSMSAKETAVYKDMMNAGVSGKDAYALLDELRGVKKTDEESKEKIKRGILRNSEISKEGKAIVYYGLMVKDNSSERRLMDELADSGADQGEIARVLMDFKDAKNGEERAEILAKANLSETQKLAIFRDRISSSREDEIKEFKNAGLSFNQYLMEYSGNSSKQASDERYDALVSAGMAPEDAYKLIGTMNALEPEEGKISVSDIQRWRACVDFTDDANDQITALSVVMDGKQFVKVKIAYSFGVAPEAYVRLQEIKSGFDKDGNEYLSANEIKAAIDSMSGLTTKQRAALWQLATGSKSARKNPYNSEMGQKVIDAKEVAKEKNASETSTTTSSGEDSLSQEVLNQILGNW